MGPSEKIFGGQADAFRAHFAKPVKPFANADEERETRTRKVGAYLEHSFAVGDVVTGRADDGAKARAAVVRVVYQPRVRASSRVKVFDMPRTRASGRSCSGEADWDRLSGIE